MKISIQKQRAASKPREITVFYSSVDSYGNRTKRTFRDLEAARVFAQHWLGEHPEIGHGAAVSDDGIGKIEVQGATLEELFPSE